MAFKTKWRHALEKTLATAGAQLKATKERYKRNYDKRLWRDNQHIRPDDNVYLRVERKNEKKLAPIADGPFLAKDVNTDDKVVTIERPD